MPGIARERLAELPRCPRGGKVRFPTKAEARAAYLPRKGDRRRHSVFRCHLCEGYHVGHR